MSILSNNRYRIIRSLGSGGFGETFLAEDTQMPSGRRCVIKQLKPVVNNPQIYQLVQERFQREAAILEELGDGSDQIPRLYAYFSENGQFYLVQEYVEGQTLTQKLQQQEKLSESSVKEILTDLLSVLDYIHSKRIVHRDIKPDNIIIRNSDGKSILIDFGAVKETMGTVVTASGNSGTSIVIGTPGFMPSEQTAGRPVFASDLYSLGLTAIYLLTGKIPQELATDFATGEILWRQFALSVTPSFAAVLDKAIQSHARVSEAPPKEGRYSSARDMLQALQTDATPSPTLVVAPSLKGDVQPRTVVSAPPSKGISDLQKVLIMGGVIGACVIGGLWLTKEQQFISSPQKPTQPVSIGWLRAGSVGNTSGNLSNGERLIPSTQPVTISPPVVPSPNSQVILTTDVNLRSNRPQPPQYDLTVKKATLRAGQRLVVLRVYSFVDPNSDSPLTKVWVEVGLPH